MHTLEQTITTLIQTLLIGLTIISSGFIVVSLKWIYKNMKLIIGGIYVRRCYSIETSKRVDL